MQPAVGVKPSSNKFALFANRRTVAILLLGFASGLPFTLSGSTLQAWFTVAGASTVTIGSLSLLGMPYVYKFLWAPLLDRFIPPWLGRRRGWILLMQMALVVVLVAMAFENPKISFWPLAILGFTLAFLSATQDIGIDAYRTDLLRTNEFGMGAAMNTAGYRVALLVSGGLALVLAGEMGWRITYLIMAGIMLIATLITLFSPPLEQPAAPPQTLSTAIAAPIKEFLSRKYAWSILIFIVLYKFGDAYALSLITAFLIRTGFSLVDVGSIYKVVGMLATLMGAAAGGVLMTRLSMFRALWYFGFLQAASNLMFMWLAIVGKSFSLMVATIFIESFTGGLATVAFVAFLMALCDRRFTATQFAVLSALSAVGRVFVGPTAGLMQQHFGWVTFFFWSFFLALPGLALLLWLKNRIDL